MTPTDSLTRSTPLLAARERQALLLLARLRFLERRQLQDFLFADATVTNRSAEVMTRRLMQRLNDRKLVARTDQQPGGLTGGSAAPVHYLTRGGARALGRDHEEPFRAPRGMLLVHHAVATADVVLAFRHAAAGHIDHELLGWSTDREIGRDLGPLPLLPDLGITYATADTELQALVEVDRGTEGSRVIAAKTLGYLELWRRGQLQQRLALWPVVLWVTTDQHRVRLIADAIERTIDGEGDRDRIRAGTEFCVTTLENLLDDSPLAPIWARPGRPGRQRLLDDEARE